MVEKKDIEEALKDVLDPDTGKSVVEMGLIKDIEIEGDIAKIKMEAAPSQCPMFSSSCPHMEKLSEEIGKKAASVKGIKKSEIEVVF